MRSFSSSILALVCLAGLGHPAAPPRKVARPNADKAIREVAGSAEFLRSLPKRFGTLVGLDTSNRRVTLLFDDEKTPRQWPLLDDAEIKVDGWWGRLDQFSPGERVWAWLKTDRKNQPVAVAMLADDLSQQDVHGVGLVITEIGKGTMTFRPEKGPLRKFALAKAQGHQGDRRVAPGRFALGDKVFVRSRGEQALDLLDPAAFELRRQKQKAILSKRWLSDGLPGGIGFVHVFSGELDLLLDHETMRWARSLERGHKVTLLADPPIPAVVKSVQPWRERTQIRLVARSSHLADLRPGQRLALKMEAPPAQVQAGKFPPDMDRTRARAERIDWFLASIYCTCGVRGDTCTGHFYTLASCNPNGCGKPNQMRKRLGGLIDKGLSDRQIFEQLLADEGPGLLQPHLLP